MKKLIQKLLDWCRINTQSPYECYWSRRALNAEANLRIAENKIRILEQKIERQELLSCTAKYQSKPWIEFKDAETKEVKQ